MPQRVICVRSFRPQYSNLKECVPARRKVPAGSVWTIWYGTTIPGIEIHLEGTKEYSQNYVELTLDQVVKHFVVL